MSEPTRPDGVLATTVAEGVSQDRTEGIGTQDVLRRLHRGSAQIIGLAFLGLTIAAIGYLFFGKSADVSTSTRVVFSFPGFGQGKYPDGSKFRLDDITSPDVVASALQTVGLNAANDLQSSIRGALAVEAIIPPDIVRVRDRTRAAGQVPPPYFADEYTLTLTLPRSFPFPVAKRGPFLGAIINAYRDKFQATYVEMPAAFGNALDALHNADLFDYQDILEPEVNKITAYLNQQIDQARDFRSVTTNLSFSDLLDRTNEFYKTRVSEVLGLIHQNGLATDRSLVLGKMRYDLDNLKEMEQSAIQDENVVEGLLAEVKDHAQNYVLAVKSQAGQSKSETPILDQGIVDSLVANDSYNFMIRKELDAGLKVKHVQAQEAVVNKRIAYLESFIKGDNRDRAAILQQTQKSIATMEAAYRTLIANVRDTQADFARQDFADAIRQSAGVSTPGMFHPLETTSVLGLFLGGVIGTGLSLLGVYLGERRR